MKFFSLVYQGDVHVSEDEKVIPAAEFSLLVEGKEIVDKAREDAEQLLEETKEKCKELKEEAEKNGFDTGLGKFNEHILYVDQELQKIKNNALDQIIPIALKAAKKIVAKELELHPDTIVDIVIQALAPVTQNRRINVYVNKEDREMLEKEKPQLKALFEQVDSFTVQERGDISKGGCIIETEKGIINATLENQWRALEAAFKRYM